MDHEAEGLPLFDPWLRIDALGQCLRHISADLEQRGSPTPAEVRDEVVIPVLRHLGWAVGDSDVVGQGLETTSGAVDFALCHPPRDPRVLVKIGALPEMGDGATEHLFEDCTLSAIQLAVSENARVWRFHFPAGRGSMRNREFARFDMVGDAEEDVAVAFDRYLEFHAVKSGEALWQAGRDYGEKRFPAEAHRAWRRSLLGQEVLQRFVREMEEATGIAPDRKRAEMFVSVQCGSIRWPPDPPDPKPVRRVTVGDKVWAYDSGSHEIVTRRVINGDPDWEQGEVSRDSPIGFALLGAREGEEREICLPGQEPRPIRIVLIGGRG